MVVLLGSAVLAHAGKNTGRANQHKRTHLFLLIPAAMHVCISRDLLHMLASILLASMPSPSVGIR